MTQGHHCGKRSHDDEISQGLRWAEPRAAALLGFLYLVASHHACRQLPPFTHVSVSVPASSSNPGDALNGPAGALWLHADRLGDCPALVLVALKVLPPPFSAASCPFYWCQ